MTLPPLPVQYTNLSQTPVKTLRCGHCGRDVASDKGWANAIAGGVSIQICPMCGRPNYFEGSNQIPGPRPGNEVLHLPPAVASLYEEARTVTAAGAPTSATLALRKLMMHVAVEKGAPPNQSSSNTSHISRLSTSSRSAPRTGSTTSGRRGMTPSGYLVDSSNRIAAAEFHHGSPPPTSFLYGTGSTASACSTRRWKSLPRDRDVRRLNRNVNSSR